MSVRESAFFFECRGESLLGLVSTPADEAAGAAGLGVLIVVGGPQYRVGSHRQFALLARHLAGEGIPCMRFDYRGMGDSSGAACGFEEIDDDLRAALDTFHERVPGLRGVVLWGLCDGASAAAFYAPTDRRVAGLVLLNPWVRTEAGEARTYLWHYYLRRLFSVAFWKKLAGGGVALGRALGEIRQRLAQLRGSAPATQGEARAVAQAALPLPERMLAALWTGGLPRLLILSGRDYVAQEFEQVLAGAAWGTLHPPSAIHRLPEADHTFSSAPWRDEVARQTACWLRTLSAQLPDSQGSAGEKHDVHAGYAPPDSPGAAARPVGRGDGPATG
ncbi:hydrolase 1, exosortase A system-associated [Pseudothauera nasutitermitis]|uniref:Hydrolase 1, exosortase A system-associated n=1 Tax=Pseudothauera nasutitermitis TaxID=2565930 RepID=A0A4S4AUK0_9RHOO|nr:hydrolase 1, exosortase A system-associated [Pseudothauera nasutitermitis]THF63641.1 hydrolase 1, exosortase A system-associated [Pseudothauera nasutitermitis]